MGDSICQSIESNSSNFQYPKQGVVMVAIPSKLQMVTLKKQF